jgi:hypothetical protein
VLVCVGSQAITGATYTHWLSVARKAREVPTRRRRGESQKERKADHDEVLNFLISAAWVKGEAVAQHVVVSASEVKRQFDRIRDQQFPHGRGFRAFLRSTGQTVADLLMRVELNMLSERLQRHATARFFQEFKDRWRAQTYCGPEWDVPDCGHVQEPV